MHIFGNEAVVGHSRYQIPSQVPGIPGIPGMPWFKDWEIKLTEAVAPVRSAAKISGGVSLCFS
jgi:hypothetical protein